MSYKGTLREGIKRSGELCTSSVQLCSSSQLINKNSFETSLFDKIYFYDIIFKNLFKRNSKL